MSLTWTGSPPPKDMNEPLWSIRPPRSKFYDEHRRAEVAGADRRGQSCAAAAGDDDVDVVVPFEAIGAGGGALGFSLVGIEQRRSADAGSSAGFDEVASA